MYMDCVAYAHVELCNANGSMCVAYICGMWHYGICECGDLKLTHSAAIGAINECRTGSSGVWNISWPICNRIVVGDFTDAPLHCIHCIRIDCIVLTTAVHMIIYTGMHAIVTATTAAAANANANATSTAIATDAVRNIISGHVVATIISLATCMMSIIVLSHLNIVVIV